MANQLDDALNNIWQMRGVTGIALYLEGQSLFRHFPGEVSADDAANFGRHVLQMVRGLSTDGRSLSQAYFGYLSGRILVSVHHEVIFVVLLRDDEALAYLSKIATAFLKDNYDVIIGVPTALPSTRAAEPAVATLDRWHRYLDGLGRILSKVIGTTQSSYVVSRVLSQEGLSQTQEIPRERYLEFGLHVINQVPNKAKQRSLADEVKILVDSLEK